MFAGEQSEAHDQLEWPEHSHDEDCVEEHIKFL